MLRHARLVMTILVATFIVGVPAAVAQQSPVADQYLSAAAGGGGLVLVGDGRLSDGGRSRDHEHRYEDHHDQSCVTQHPWIFLGVGQSLKGYGILREISPAGLPLRDAFTRREIPAAAPCAG